MKPCFRVRTILPVVSLLLSIRAGAIDCAPGSSEFGGGSGTPDDPFVVCTPTHLNNVRLHLDAHFVQVADIDLGNSGLFEPIGGEQPSDGFSGIYDGVGHSIANLSIVEQTTGQPVRSIGLFRRQTGAIRNLTLTNALVICVKSPNNMTVWVGAVAGASEGVMFNVHVEGTVSAVHQWASLGGLAGACHGCEFTRSSFSGTIVGAFGYIGGLCGDAFVGGAKITDCYVDGIIEATQLSVTAGLVGTAPDFIHVVSSYFFGYFRCNELCGISFAASGLVAGGDPLQITVEQCFWSGPYSVPGIIPVESTGGGARVHDWDSGQYLKVLEREGSKWDFENVWTVVDGLPKLRIPTDSDNDGVFDGDDACNQTPAHVYVDLHGRPIGDLDGDCDQDLLDFRIFQWGAAQSRDPKHELRRQKSETKP